MALPSKAMVAGREERGLVLDLSELENVVLSLAASGEVVHPIGPWAKAVASLLAKGLLKHELAGGYRITTDGDAAFEQIETDEMRGMIGEHNARVRERNAPVIEGRAEEDPRWKTIRDTAKAVQTDPVYWPPEDSECQ